MSSGAIILINGYPGVGKLSTAQRLTKILPNSKVLDTHHLKDATSSLFDQKRDVEAWNALHSGLRDAIFRSIKVSGNSRSQPIYILTESIPACPAGAKDLQSLLAHARDANFTLIHIILSCSTSENIHRLHSPERRFKNKLTDEGALMELRMEEEIARFGGGIMRKKVGGLGGEYEIDTEAVDPKGAAAIVGEYALDALRRQGWFIQLNRVK
ncbi:hypothetical protein L198_06370 [Cryptococcus wingfieldii CBS 7118]|uniref:Uncharacterized protein n=1 Tax=Cryptococcus wingfieldii CBS 7118 TaxID=1295528 RepID=A0A1E3IM53_9TREE|nr:hypothetical protein L198_06370 [Cryptococcus wingfieldii CBS 7118]ODN89680.1 hypothetical protein L198_06370 [Cryptococcus wingfieldii CBS 7118]